MEESKKSATTHSVPNDWDGKQHSLVAELVRCRFPCIGQHCWSNPNGPWHAKGVKAFSYRDSVRYRGNCVEWQRMCTECFNNRGALVRSINQYQSIAAIAATASTSSQLFLPTVPQLHQPFLPTASVDNEYQVSDFGIAESIHADAQPPIIDDYLNWDDDFIDSLLGEKIGGEVGENWETILPTGEEDLEQDPTLQLPPHPPPVSYYTHGSKDKAGGKDKVVGEVKMQLGMGIWKDIADRLPRVQKDGLLKLTTDKKKTLSSPASSAELMNNYGLEFPHSPLYQPPRAEQRAHAFKKENGAVWTSKEKCKAMNFFAAEAAMTKAFIICPEVSGRDELLADKRYRTTAGGCMCICPSCKVNTQ